MAYHSITRSWHKERFAESNRIPSLLSQTSQDQRLQSRSLLPLDLFRIPTFFHSGLRFFPSGTLQGWKSQIKGLAKLDELGDAGAEEHIAFEADDSGLDLGDCVLLPALNSIQNRPNLSDRRAQ
ncbi:hypothetical protein DM02DRAFT_664136, partial [Periconia macrospinosa]